MHKLLICYVYLRRDISTRSRNHCKCMNCANLFFSLLVAGCVFSAKLVHDGDTMSSPRPNRTSRQPTRLGEDSVTAAASHAGKKKEGKRKSGKPTTKPDMSAKKTKGKGDKTETTNNQVTAPPSQIIPPDTSSRQVSIDADELEALRREALNSRANRKTKAPTSESGNEPKRKKRRDNKSNDEQTGSSYSESESEQYESEPTSSGSESSDSSSSVIGNASFTFGENIHAHVKKKVRESILNNKYVRFSNLLPDNNGATKKRE